MLDQLQTLFSPQGSPIVMTFAVMALAFVLVSIMQRIVTLVLRGRPPYRIARVTILAQVAVLVGELALIISFIAPGWLVVLFVSLVSALVAAALFPGNPISDTLAFIRIRSLHYYRVGDWVTVADNQYGHVVAISPLRTLLLTPTQRQVGLHNSLVVGAPIVVHRDQTAPTVDVGQVTVVESMREGSAHVEQVLPIVLPTPVSEASLGKTAPLVKRPVLGKRSIKPLLFR